MKFYLVDAFTDQPFLGNPAAVCFPDEPLTDGEMQNIAMEMNQSESAFLFPRDGKKLQHSSLFSLRWFTPKKEIDLCGHATLASAKVIFDLQKGKNRDLAFETRSGVLKVSMEALQLRMQLPINPPRSLFSQVSLKEVLLVDEIVATLWNEDLGYLLVHLPSEEDVETLAPDFTALLHLDLEFDLNGLIVTAKGEPPFTFVSRFFAPWLGINEDPVTGSSHTLLFPYWENLTGLTEMRAHQISKRGGELTLCRHDDHHMDIMGQAVVVVEGEILPRVK